MVNTLKLVGGIVVLAIAGGVGYLVQMILNTAMGVLVAGMILVGVVGGRIAMAAVTGSNRSSGDYGTNRESKGQRR